MILAQKKMPNLYEIKAGEIWAYLKTQDILFWLVNIYLFLEYVRPQTLYPVLDVLPFSQILLITTLILAILRGNFHFFQNSASKFLWLFLGIVLLSSTFAILPAIAFSGLPNFIAWMIAYFLIINIVTTERRFLVFMLAFLLYSFKMSQFSFLNWASRGFSFYGSGTGGGPGWFHNSGEFGVQMCVFLPLSFYFLLALKENWQKGKRFFFSLFPFTALMGMISCSSRGTVVGGAAVVLWMFMKSKNKIKGLVLVFITSLIFFLLLPEEQADRFQSAGEDRTSITRLERWDRGLEMARMYPWFGVGFENWSIASKAIFQAGPGESHNIFIECVSELGYSGLSVLVLMILSVFWNNHQTRKIVSENINNNRFIYYMGHGLDAALIGFLASGFFVTVLYYPYFWINMAMTVALNRIARKIAAENDIVESKGKMLVSQGHWQLSSG